MTHNKITNPLQFFSGGVPASAIFGMSVKELRTIVNTRDKGFKHSTEKCELCLIGLTAYFEAFFKDHFSSLINIYPNLLFNLRANSHDVNIDICNLLEFNISSIHYYGFIIAERYDFGTPAKINSIYNSLMNITPLSKDEKYKYEKILNDRNLLVHHGGIFTSKYLKQQTISQQISERVFMDSLVLSKKDVISHIEFCEGIVKKFCKVTQFRMKEIIKKSNIKLSKHVRSAIEYLDLEV